MIQGKATGRRKCVIYAPRREGQRQTSALRFDLPDEKTSRETRKDKTQNYQSQILNGTETALRLRPPYYAKTAQR